MSLFGSAVAQIRDSQETHLIETQDNRTYIAMAIWFNIMKLHLKAQSDNQA